jgi:hypothetical protein
MPFEPPLYTEGLGQPPVRRYTGPIIDAHTHVEDVANAWLLFRAAQAFGVQVFCGVVRPAAIDALKREFGESFRPIVRVDHSLIGQPSRFARENVLAIREGRAKGAVAAKFWYAPRFIAETHFRFDNPALRPILATLVDLGMPALVHVADPDCWFERQYSDVARYGTKAEQYDALEHTLSDLPGLKVQGAHFGGDPEDLGHLRLLMDKYPNYYVDTSATKWIARELSAHPAESRAFVLERADRIVFGSDLVAFGDATPAHYGSRYWVQRWLWEGEGARPSPIADPCVADPEGVTVHGLALPDDVLAKLYIGNARRLLGIEI